LSGSLPLGWLGLAILAGIIVLALVALIGPSLQLPVFNFAPPPLTPSPTIFVEATAMPTGAPTVESSPTPTSMPPVEIVVDEASVGFLHGGSFWRDGSVGQGGHTFWTYNRRSQVDSWGEWHPDLPQCGTYEVAAFVPPQFATTARANYEVYHRDGVTKVQVDQGKQRDAWASLGQFVFPAGKEGYVRLTDATGETEGARQIAFDAMKWRLVSPCATPTPVVTTEATPTALVSSPLLVTATSTMPPVRRSTATPTTTPAPTSTPTPVYPKPKLIKPENNNSFSGQDAFVMLEWEPVVSTLGPDEWYEVIVAYVSNGQMLTETAWVKDSNWPVPSGLWQKANLPERAYQWNVTVVHQTGTRPNGRREGAAISPTSETWVFQWH
jgi:hypothetical protein